MIKRARGRRCFAREVVAMAPCTGLPNNSLQLTRQVELCLVPCGSRASARLWHAASTELALQLNSCSVGRTAALQPRIPADSRRR